MPERKSKAETQRAAMAILLDGEPTANTLTNATETLFIGDLVPYADHPFKLYEGERLNDMVRSVRERGVIVPVIVRPLDEGEDTYEILSGHNRVNAAKMAGLKKVPVVIKTGLDDEEAKLIVTETNLVQRSFADLSHSERAIALKTHMDAISNQGKRTDLLDELKTLFKPHEIEGNGTSAQVERKLESREITAEKYGLSRANVSRYIRLSHLIHSLMNRIDSDEIAFIPAVSLSYLSTDEQTELNRLLDESAYKIDMKKAESLREFSENKKLTNEKIMQILSGELNKKPKSKTTPPFKLKAKIYQKHFDGDTPQSEMEIVIDEALTEYFEKRRQEENA
jgi:ParB family chromosome partitioning protein